MPSAETPVAAEGTPPTHGRTVIWVSAELVCVEIIDSPPPHEGAGVCRCPACHGAAYADLAAKLFPPR